MSRPSRLVPWVFRPLARWGPAASLLAALAAVGCLGVRKPSGPPCPHYARGLEVSEPTAPPGTYPPVDPAIAASLTDKFADPPAPAAAPLPTKPINVLAISGGGQYGAYLGGILVGWSQRGDRPTFDVVTGISSGALIAAMAFAGPKYDPVMQEVLTNIKGEDLFKYRPVVYLLKNKSIASSDPLARLLERTVTAEYLCDLRAAHAAGRRLFVGTMDLHSRRLVVWDVGALACSGRPDADRLVRKVLLAACSIPGLVPPVEFNVTVDGRTYTEQHGDGGAVAQVFVRFGPEQPRYGQAGPGGKWLPGSNLYLFAGGKLYADPLPAGDIRFLARVTGTVSATLYALYRAELMKYHALCQASGMGFNVVAIPQDMKTATKSVDFDPAEMRRLFGLGYDTGVAGVPWRRSPPGANVGEEEVPRGGFEFVTHPGR